MKKLFLIIIICSTSTTLVAQQEYYVFKDANKNIEERLSNLLQQLTLPEKISLLGFRSKAVPRLGIAAYNWWNEALHGIARAGKATVFPQAIAMAASFNELWQQVLMKNYCWNVPMPYLPKPGLNIT